MNVEELKAVDSYGFEDTKLPKDFDVSKFDTEKLFGKKNLELFTWVSRVYPDLELVALAFRDGMVFHIYDSHKYEIYHATDAIELYNTLMDIYNEFERAITDHIVDNVDTNKDADFGLTYDDNGEQPYMGILINDIDSQFSEFPESNREDAIGRISGR